MSDKMPTAGEVSFAVPRRVVLQGAAWGVPAVSFATAVPAAAGTGPQIACEDISFTVEPHPDPENPMILSASAGISTYGLTITSTLDAGTIVSQANPRRSIPETSFNLTTLGSGWNGDYDVPGDSRYPGDRIFNGFVPPGQAYAIVLNQRGPLNDPNYTPGQTLSFIFTENGQPFQPTDLSLEIFDISAVHNQDGDSWAQNYFDSVGFNQTPQINFSGYLGLDDDDEPILPPAIGNGTTADPYRRPVHLPSPSTRDPDDSSTPGRQHFIRDRFTFPGELPGSLEMRYTNFGRGPGSEVPGSGANPREGNHRGWQFIAISAIQFTDEDCI